MYTMLRHRYSSEGSGSASALPAFALGSACLLASGHWTDDGTAEHTEAEVRGAIRRRGPETVRGAALLRGGDPVAAARHAGRAQRGPRLRNNVRVAIPVVAPLQQAAVDVKQAS